MLLDAHQVAIHTLRKILSDDVHGNNRDFHHDQTHTGDTGTANNIANCDHIGLLYFNFPYSILRHACS